MGGHGFSRAVRSPRQSAVLAAGDAYIVSMAMRAVKVVSAGNVKMQLVQPAVMALERHVEIVAHNI